MSFKCPSCHGSSIDIASSIEFPPDAQSDEITLQIVTCSICHFHGLAVYQESRRGSFDTETWHHDGYIVGAESFDSVLRAVESCPSPHNPECTCPAHAVLGQLDERQYWNGLHGIKIDKDFKMQFTD